MRMGPPEGDPIHSVFVLPLRSCPLTFAKQNTADLLASGEGTCLTKGEIRRGERTVNCTRPRDLLQRPGSRLLLLAGSRVRPPHMRCRATLDIADPLRGSA